MCRALDEMFEESTNKGIQMGIKQGIERGIEQGIEQGIERGVKNTQIKIAIKMLVRHNQTLEEISEIVGLDLNALRELKRVFNRMDVRSHPFFLFKILKNLLKIFSV